MSTVNTEKLNVTKALQLPSYTEAQRDALTGLQAGDMIFNTDNYQVQVWNGAGWVTGGAVANDGSTAEKAVSNVLELRQAGVTADGVYWFKDPTGQITYQAYALMNEASFDTNATTGGWVLAYNYNANSGAQQLGGVPWYGNTTFWQTRNQLNNTSTTPWTVQVKTRAYDLYNFSHILFVVHKRTGYQPNGTSLRGWGMYKNDNFVNNSIYDILINGSNDQVVSVGGRSNGVNYGSNFGQNSRRTDQPHGGDIFIDGTVNGYNNATYNLVFNAASTYIWGASQNNTRITTTIAANTSRGHTVAGMGIQHQFSSWGTQMSWAPVSAYCDTPVVYGPSGTEGTNNFNGSSEPNGMGYGMYSHNAPNGCTNGHQEGYIDAGISVFVR